MSLDPELQEQAGNAMQAFLSEDEDLRTEAYHFLREFQTKEPLSFVKFLISCLSNEQMPPKSRTLASIFLYDSLHKRTPDKQILFLQSWKKLDDLETREQLRLAAFSGLTSDDESLRFQCSNLLGLFYSIENFIGASETDTFTFSDSFSELIKLSVESDDENLKVLFYNIFAYFSLNLIELSDKCYSKQSVKKFAPLLYESLYQGLASESLVVQEKSLEAFAISFVLFKRTFSFDKTRNQLLEAVFTLIQSEEEKIFSKAYQLLIICIDTCYFQMIGYMENIEEITHNDLQSGNAERQVEACLLWKYVAEVESDILNPDKESVKKKHLDNTSMVLLKADDDVVLFSKWAFDNLFDILVELMCGVDPNETDVQTISERTPQQAALACMDLLIKAIKRDALPRIYEFVEQNSSSEDWRIRYGTAILLNGASQDLNNDDYKNILVAFDFFVHAIADDVPRISDVAMQALARLINKFPDLILNQDLFGNLCESAAGKMNSDALASRACWLLSICFSKFSKDDEESPLVANFEKFSELLLECADKYDDEAPDAAFSALVKLLENTPSTIADQYNKLFEMITAKLQFLIAQHQSESDRNNEKYTQMMIGLLTLVHHIIMNVGPMISNISDQLMEMLNEALDFQNGNLVSEILPAMGAIARAIQSDFTKFIPSLIEKVYAYLEKGEFIEPAATFIGDIFNSSPDPPFPDDLVEKIVGVLSDVLSNDSQRPRTRIFVFSALANIAFYIGEKCESWIGGYLDSLEAEAKSLLSDNNTVDHEDAQSFTLECINIYQGLLPIMKSISIGERRVKLFFNLFEKIDKLDYIRNYVLTDSVYLISDIAKLFEKKLSVYLNRPAVLHILNIAINAKMKNPSNPELVEFSEYAQDTLKFVQNL